MNPERWQKIEKIFHSALECAPEERAAFLDEACAGDQSLLKEVVSLIVADEQGRSFIEPSEGPQTKPGENRSDVMVGKEVGPYEILSMLGAGGMAEVYLAQDTRLGRRVALKLLNEGLAADDDQRRRFTQEAKAASALNHPHILTIYDIGSEHGRNYIAMEYIEGETLRERVKKTGPLPVKLVLDLGAQIASALSRAHRAGIIHRDLKPENIMLSLDGYTKILDFGLAKLMEQRRESGSEAETALLSGTCPGTVMGTPRYMSPEQARGGHLDARSDTFSFGCVLYEMATGCAAFEGASLFDTLNAIINSDPASVSEVNPDAPPQLESIIAKCLEKEPSDRYQHADDIEADLRRLRINVEAIHGAKERLKILRKIPGRLLLILALYLIGAWISTRIVEWVAGRYVLSPYLVDFATVALLSLIPAVLLLAHFRRRPLKKKWRRLRIIGIPANLLAATALLFLLFHGKDLGAATKSILVQNEQGQLVERIVPKSEFRRKLAIFFFDNQSGDSSLDWLQYGLSEMLTFDLSQDMFLHEADGYEAYEKTKKAGFPKGVNLPMTLKMKIADSLHLAYFVSGSFTKQDAGYSIRVSLHETKSGQVAAEKAYIGSDLYKLVDEMSVQIKRDLKIPNGHIDTVKDQPVSTFVTDSIPALQLFVTAMNELTFNYNWQKAMVSLEQAVKIDPTFVFANLYLYLIYEQSNQGEKRKQAAIESAMQHRYKCTGRWEYLVKALHYGFKEQPDMKLRVVKAWTEEFPDDTLGHQILAQLYMVSNQLDAAISENKEILELDPEQFDVLQSIGRLYRQKGQYDEALKYYEQYAGRFPNDADSFVALGGLHKNLGDFQQSKIYYEKASLIEPDRVSILLALARLDFDSGKFEQAFKQGENALNVSKTPQDRSTAYAYLSSFYETKGQIGKSVQYMNLMLAEGDKFLPELMRLSFRLEGLDKYIKAGKKELAFQTIKAIEARLRPPMDKVISFGYLHIYLELEDADNASKAVEGCEKFIASQGIEIFRTNIVSAQGKIHEIRGQYEQAIVSFTSQQELEPSNAEINMYIGRCHRNLKEFDKAEQYIQKALKIYPFSPAINYELALVYSDIGNREKALEHLRTAASIWKDADPQYKLARKAKEKLAEVEATP